MKIYTAHLRPYTAPVLVREGFSVAALVFGPLWLFVRGAWIAGIVLLAAELVAGLLPGLAAPLVVAGLVLLGGFSGHDAVRWQLARGGFVLAHVLAARSAEAAFARLLEARPDLIVAAAAL